MISNLTELIKKNRLSTEEIELINNCLKKEIMPYLLTKYPKSEDSEKNLRLASLIRSFDNVDCPENDLITKSGIKFEYSESEEYYV